MVGADDLDTTKYYKYSTNGYKLGKFIGVFDSHLNGNSQHDQAESIPRIQTSYKFKNDNSDTFNLVPSQNLEFIIEDPDPAPAGSAGAGGRGRGRYRTTRRKKLKRARKSHKNNKK